ncbi:MAG: alkyl sulfatase dimerization domain-containing protein [Pseudomonadota bacterium]
MNVNKTPFHRICFSLLAATVLSCERSSEEHDQTPGSQGNSPATSIPTKANRHVAAELDLTDERDFEDARRGLIARDENLVVSMADGETIWSMPEYGFIKGEAPPSVNPSLWRQAKLNNIHGLFEVTDGIYQLRGYDLANMTIIEGENGWIVVDPLTTKETAAAAISFARQNLGDRPVSAVIITHSHIDHFGGVLSVLDTNGGTQLIAPAGFMEEATSENVIAGSTMSRRAMFMYGSQLERSPRGHIGSGLGKNPAMGSPGIARPTQIIQKTGERMRIDGVEFVFQNAAGSEAPAELTFYLPEKKAFCGAEVVSRNMHNLYTLRGAKVRDAVKWSSYIDEAISMFPDTEVYFGSHHWPMWGNADIIAFLKKQRDTYRYIHDQTLRLASQGLTPKEIAEDLKLPASLRASFPNRGYYGTVKHNAKAVYQRYFGWYDGNPANLDPLPPSKAARHYVEAMGGPGAVLSQAETSFNNGEYRWTAELLNHLVFVDPKNREAKELLAKTYDQLGYQAESGPWRDVYLTGALELRQGPPRAGIALANATDLLRETPIDEFMQVITVMLNGPNADGKSLTIDFVFTDLGERHRLELENAVLHHRVGEFSEGADATLNVTHDLFLQLITRQIAARDLLLNDEISVEGSRIDLLRFFTLLDPADDVFNIVTP